MIDLEPSEAYIVSIFRGNEPEERLSFELFSPIHDTEYISDTMLENNRNSLNQHFIEKVDTLIIHSLNYKQRKRPTFEIKVIIWSQFFGPIDVMIVRMIWILGTILCCCFCLSCFSYIFKARENLIRRLEANRLSRERDR
jgi:hypothetical protein